GRGLPGGREMGSRHGHRRTPLSHRRTASHRRPRRGARLHLQSRKGMESDGCRDRATLSRADRQAITEYTMVMGRCSRKTLAALAGAAIALTAQAMAETVTVGLVGAVSSTHWPIYIGLAKGYFAAESLTPDLVFIQSSAALVQQLTAG